MSLVLIAGTVVETHGDAVGAEAGRADVAVAVAGVTDVVSVPLTQWSRSVYVVPGFNQSSSCGSLAISFDVSLRQSIFRAPPWAKLSLIWAMPSGMRR